MSVSWLSSCMQLELLPARSMTTVCRSFIHLDRVRNRSCHFHSYVWQKRAYSKDVGTTNLPAPRVAVVGSGPAGFYTARKLMREVPGTKIDMYEQLPVPFGLVRFGVAPDHPEVKNCQDEFEEVASSPDYNFIGNIQLGHDISLTNLASHYDAIVFSYGASKDRKLGLQGEDKPHIYSARAFVGWYNGLPEYRNLNPDLTVGENAIVVGQGNVALDVARILLSDVDVLQRTDLTNYAIETLKKSKIKHVHVVGRRGPMQAAFTIKEVRELIKMDGVNFHPIPQELFPENISKLERPKRRLMELLVKGKPLDSTAKKSWSLDFLLSPKSLEWANDEPNRLTGITFVRNALEQPDKPSSKVKSLNTTETIATSIMFRSIGYKAEAISGMDEIGATFDEQKGVLKHDGTGRVISTHDKLSNQYPARLYCAGWVKRGPTGVIASTMTDAFQTAEAIAEDWRNKVQQSASLPKARGGWDAVKDEAEQRGARLNTINWDGWHRIDAAEKQVGSATGKPREKFGTVEEMLHASIANPVTASRGQ